MPTYTYVKINAAGCVEMSLLTSNPLIPDGMFDASDANVDLSTSAFDGVSWSARPVLSTPVQSQTGVIVSGLPSDAEVVIIDIPSGEELGRLQPEADGSVEIVLPDPSEYQIEVEAPAPWLSSTLKVTVTE
jgi:hypothetical protein